MRRFFSSFFLVVLIMTVFAINASAYLDPSVMTYAIQVVAGVVIAGGAALAIYWKKIKLFFKKRKQNKNKK